MRYRLEELFDLQMGKTPARANLEYWNGTNKWVSISDLSSYDKYVTDTNECISDLGVSESGIKVVPKNTVIMSFKLSIGKTAITTEEVYTNEAIMAFIDKGICEINTDYLYYLFSGTDWNKGTNKAVLGLTLNKATLSKKEIDIPDLHTQNEVVKKLDTLSNVIQLQKHSLDKLDELIKSRFVEMFGDLADPKCNWEKYSLTNLCNKKGDIKCGPFGTQLSKDEYTDSGIAIWEIPQINSAFSLPPTHFLKKEKAKELQDYSLIAGDIAMSRKGNVGRCAIFPDGYEDGIIHSDVLRIRLNKEKVNPIFIMCQLHFSRYVTKQIELVSHGAIMAGINVTKLKDILLHVPPIVFQNQFADFVTQVEKQKATVQQSIDKLETLKKSLMQEYFG